MNKKPSKKLLEKRRAFLMLFHCFYDTHDVGNQRYEIVERETNQIIGYMVFTEPRTASDSAALHNPHQTQK